MHETALNIPASGLAQFVLGLAQKHHISATRTYADEWGDAVTRLAGDEITLDGIERLLISLRRANKVSSDQMAIILARYLREKKSDVRPV
jgi:hypothetical protein